MIALSVLSVSGQICGLAVKAYSLFIKWSDCIDFSLVNSRDAVIQMVVVNLTHRPSISVGILLPCYMLPL